jgi:hypothetical protein
MFDTTAQSPMAHPLARFVCFCALGVLIYMALRKYFVEAVPVAVLFWGVAGAKHFSHDLVNVIPAIKRATVRCGSSRQMCANLSCHQ